MKTITMQHIRAAYEALGLDPDKFDGVMLIKMTPSQVQVTRQAYDKGGRAYTDESGEVATTTATIPVCEGRVVKRDRAGGSGPDEGTTGQS